MIFLYIYLALIIWGFLKTWIEIQEQGGFTPLVISNLNPWYIIVWGVIWFPFFYIGKIYLFIIVLCWRGLEEAMGLWEELT